MAALRAAQIEDELEADGRAEARDRQKGVAQRGAVRVDADQVAGAIPIDGADIEAEIDIRFVTGDPERSQAEPRRQVGAIAADIPRWSLGPVIGASVNDDGRVLVPSAHRDDAIVLLRIEGIEPQPIAI